MHEDEKVIQEMRVHPSPLTHWLSIRNNEGCKNGLSEEDKEIYWHLPTIGGKYHGKTTDYFLINSHLMLEK